MTMSIAEISESGTSTARAEGEPSLTYVLDVCDDLTVLRLVEAGEPAWKNPDPAKRAEAILRWANDPRPPAPDIPIEFLSREYLYD
jgi:hypothetical protein